jgi:hypothetical protein
VVSAAAGAFVVSAGAACSVVVSVFFFAHPLSVNTDTETHSMIATRAINLFNTFHLLMGIDVDF